MHGSDTLGSFSFLGIVLVSWGGGTSLKLNFNPKPAPLC
jgi:hypothetical protein